jgi:hypothetical protein
MPERAGLYSKYKKKERRSSFRRNRLKILQRDEPWGGKLMAENLRAFSFLPRSSIGGREKKEVWQNNDPLRHPMNADPKKDR